MLSRNLVLLNRLSVQSLRENLRLTCLVQSRFVGAVQVIIVEKLGGLGHHLLAVVDRVRSAGWCLEAVGGDHAAHLSLLLWLHIYRDAFAAYVFNLGFVRSPVQPGGLRLLCV